VVQRPPLPYRPFVRREHLPDCVLDAQPAHRVPTSAVGFSALIPDFPDGEGFSVIVAWTGLSPRGDSRRSSRQVVTVMPAALSLSMRSVRIAVAGVVRRLREADSDPRQDLENEDFRIFLSSNKSLPGPGLLSDSAHA
jgi:hypothetical protein